MNPGLIVNDRIRAIREHKGLNASDLARAAGLSQSEISQIESGLKRSPRMETIQRIAYAFDVSIDYLIGRHDYEGPLGRALALESLALMLKKAKLSEEQARALREIGETNSAPQSISAWETFVSNLAAYESAMGRLRQ